MSASNLSEEVQKITVSALHIAQLNHHAELDSSHLFYAFVQESQLGQEWLEQAQQAGNEDIAAHLRSTIDQWYPPSQDFTEPTANYLRVMQSAENLAVSAGLSEVSAAHIYASILQHDHRLLEWLGQNGAAAVSVKEKTHTPTLDQISRDLTALARKKKLAPVIGRENEVQQLVEALLRQGKRNALLLGAAGVGKTAVVERLAQDIASKNVPAKLKSARIIELNLSALSAGTSFRGEFEARMNALLKELSTDEHVILVIDEFHALMGTGKVSGGGPDAVSILKPALARGEITCIGITTDEDFVRFVESDSALVRRFEIIHVPEPSPEDTVFILQELLPTYIQHHQVEMDPETLKIIVNWSQRFLPSRHFPDKAIDILGKVFARAELKNLPRVDQELIAGVMTDIAGVPVGDVDQQMRALLANLEEELSRQVIGQEAAVQALSQTVRLAYSGLRDPRRPKGVFLFVGPSGVGKTELARALASALFGSENALIRLDMSEFAERINVSRLVGSAPGYIGHDEPGQLTQALRDHPHSVVLFDEVEKACPEVFDLFLQLFDEGRLTDSHGRLADGRNAFFIMTSNLLVKKTSPVKTGFAPAQKQNSPDIDANIRSFFRPELINRIDHIIHFQDLEIEDLVLIAGLEMEHLASRIKEQGIRLSFEQGVLTVLAQEASKKESGARAINSVLEQLISIPISNLLLQQQDRTQNWIHVQVEKNSLLLTWI